VNVLREFQHQCCDHGIINQLVLVRSLRLV
jgi:hypothetical protein